MPQLCIDFFKLAVMSDFRDIWCASWSAAKYPMKTSNFRDLFARDRALRKSRTKTPVAPTNAPPSPDAVDGTTSGMPMGYTHSWGTRIHIRVTDTEIPDSPEAQDNVCSSGDVGHTKKEKLLDKDSGPVLALMSVPASKDKSKG